MNQSQFSSVSIGSRLSLSRNDFRKLLILLYTDVQDKEASELFDYLLLEKKKTVQIVYPKLEVHLQSDANAKSFVRKLNQLIIPSKISLSDFMMFIQRDHRYLFNQIFIKKVQLPIQIVALRITIELFRILSGETQRVSISTILGYANRAELMPLSFPQLLHAFKITSECNFIERNLKDLDKECKELRTYHFQEFLKAFQPLVLESLYQFQLNFIDKHCINQFMPAKDASLSLEDIT